MAEFKVTIRIAANAFERLYGHLFPGDSDEHAAVLLCGVQMGPTGLRLLVRDIILAEEGAEFVGSQRGYKELTAAFVAKWARTCANDGLAYIAVHNHFEGNSVSFSLNDLESHERGYPGLLQLTKGGPVGALVFASNAVAGDIWFPWGRSQLDSMTVIGNQVRILRAKPLASEPQEFPDVYDRHFRLFGDAGQNRLRALKGVIIGLGGGGSLVNEWLSRLGVGHLVAIDPKRIRESNRPRIVGASHIDVRRKRFKVDIAKRVALQANPEIQFDAVRGDVRDLETAQLVTDADFVILAGDTFASRNVFNRLVMQYLIPGFHVGTKIETNSKLGTINRIRAETRIVMPTQNGGCLRCNGLIPPERLRLEELTPEEFQAQNYLDQHQLSEPQPSVITLNVLSAAQAVNDLMMLFTGLYDPAVKLSSIRHDVAVRKFYEVGHAEELDCPHCSRMQGSAYAMGDRSALPCRSNRGVQICTI